MTTDSLTIAVAALRRISCMRVGSFSDEQVVREDLQRIATEALAAIDALDARCKQCKGKGKLYGAQYGQSRPGYRTIDCDACGGTGKRADAALSAPAAVVERSAFAHADHVADEQLSVLRQVLKAGGGPNLVVTAPRATTAPSAERAVNAAESKRLLALVDDNNADWGDKEFTDMAAQIERLEKELTNAASAAPKE